MPRRRSTIYRRWSYLGKLTDEMITKFYQHKYNTDDDDDELFIGTEDDFVTEVQTFVIEHKLMPFNLNEECRVFGIESDIDSDDMSSLDSNVVEDMQMEDDLADKDMDVDFGIGEGLDTAPDAVKEEGLDTAARDEDVNEGLDTAREDEHLVEVGEPSNNPFVNPALPHVAAPATDEPTIQLSLRLFLDEINNRLHDIYGVFAISDEAIKDAYHEVLTLFGDDSVEIDDDIAGIVAQKVVESGNVADMKYFGLKELFSSPFHTIEGVPPVCINPIDGDNRCCFKTLALLLEIPGGYQQVKNDIINYFIKLGADYTDEGSSDTLDERMRRVSSAEDGTVRSFQEYVNWLRDKDSWGGELEFWAASNIYKRAILVTVLKSHRARSQYTSNLANQDGDVILLGKHSLHIPSSGSDEDPVIVFFTGTHFDAAFTFSSCIDNQDIDLSNLRDVNSHVHATLESYPIRGFTLDGGVVRRCKVSSSPNTPQAVKSQEDEFKLAKLFMESAYKVINAKKDKKKTRKNEEEEDEDEEEEVLEVGNSSWWKDDTDEKKKTFRESKSSRNGSTSDIVEGTLLTNFLQKQSASIGTSGRAEAAEAFQSEVFTVPPMDHGSLADQHSLSPEQQKHSLAAWKERVDLSNGIPPLRVIPGSNREEKRLNRLRYMHLYPRDREVGMHIFNLHNENMVFGGNIFRLYRNPTTNQMTLQCIKCTMIFKDPRRARQLAKHQYGCNPDINSIGCPKCKKSWEELDVQSTRSLGHDIDLSDAISGHTSNLRMIHIKKCNQGLETVLDWFSDVQKYHTLFPEQKELIKLGQIGVAKNGQSRVDVMSRINLLGEEISTEEVERLVKLFTSDSEMSCLYMKVNSAVGRDVNYNLPVSGEAKQVMESHGYTAEYTFFYDKKLANAHREKIAQNGAKPTAGGTKSWTFEFCYKNVPIIRTGGRGKTVKCMKDLEEKHRITFEKQTVGSSLLLTSSDNYFKKVVADQDVEWNLLTLRKFKSNEALVYANNLNETSMSAWIKAIRQKLLE